MQAKNKTTSPTSVDPIVMRPGDSWFHVGGAYYDHGNSGLRIHVAGLCRLPLSREIVNGRQWPESMALREAIRICGGNRKRGVMVWALNLLERGYA